MATYTSNINLKKPAQSDKIRIADFNGNADNIDAAIGADFGQGTKPSINQAINSLADGLAIIANGNVHAAITAGQFVYVRNHDTLSEGLYVASSNISANGTLSGSNLTSDESGGLNALNSNISDLPTIETSGWTPTFGRDTPSSMYATWVRIGTILFITAVWNNTHGSGASYINANSLPTIPGYTYFYAFHGTWRSNTTDSAGEVGQYSENANIRFSKEGVGVELPNEPISFNAWCLLKNS